MQARARSGTALAIAHAQDAAPNRPRFSATGSVNWFPTARDAILESLTSKSFCEFLVSFDIPDTEAGQLHSDSDGHVTGQPLHGFPVASRRWAFVGNGDRTKFPDTS